MAILFKIRSWVLAVIGRIQWAPLLLARLTVGVLFLQTGWGKLHHLDKVVEFFSELGIPAPGFHAPFVAGNELVCGTLILIGLFTRVATIPLMISMCVALFTAKRGDVMSLSDLFSLSEFLYIVILLTLAVYGPGPLSADGWLVARFAKKSKGR